MAFSFPLVAILTSSSGLLSPKIIDSANRNSTIPQAILKAESEIAMAVKIASPAITKKMSIIAEAK